jgi:multidrug efflux system membrane fusion protein
MKSASSLQRQPARRVQASLAGLALLAALAGPHAPALAQAGKPGSGGPPVTPVAAVKAKSEDVKVYLSALGSVTSLHTVTVKSRVDGELMEVLYKEGQPVSAGSLLARIDPRPFEVQLNQAQGQLARDQAQLENARVDQQRYRELWEQNSIPKQQLDTQEAQVRQFEGVVKVDQALVEAAKLQLTYSRITSPVSGRAGLRLVDPGNMVRASDSGGLVVIAQTQPIGVVFALPEDSLPQVLAKLKSGAKLPVEAMDREQKRKLAEGQLLTVDNQIDPATGTVKLKAVFLNQNNELFPNQFVNARMQVDMIKGAVVVPAAAVQRGPQGAFVYLVKPDNVAEMRKIELGDASGGRTVVSKGLAEGDLVVVDGADRLREGAPVAVKGPAGQPGQGGNGQGGQPANAGQNGAARGQK